jgi:Na+/phosphate symporter
LLAFVLYKTGAPGVFVLVGVAAFLLVRSHVVFAQKARIETTDNKLFSSDLKSLVQAIDESKEETVKNLKLASKAYSTSIEALAKEKKNAIAKSLEKIHQLGEQNSKVQNKIIKYVRKMPKRNLAASRLYLLIFDYMQDLYQSVQLISESCIDHLNNFHSLPSKEFLKASDEMEKLLSNYISLVIEGISSSSFKNADKITEQHDALTRLIDKTVDHVISEIQKGDIGNRIGQLQMKLLLETKDILIAVQNMYSLYYDYQKQN